MNKLLPCPFCGETPVEESTVLGTQYDIECDCGHAMSCIQISDLMTRDERGSVTFKDHKYPQQYIDRARDAAVRNWNDRVSTVEVKKDLVSRLISAFVAGCNCSTKTPDWKYHNETCHYRCHYESIEAIQELEQKNTYLRSAQDSTYRDNEKLRRLIRESTIENVPADLQWLWEDIRDEPEEDR